MTNAKDIENPLQSASDLQQKAPAFQHGCMVDQLSKAKELPPLRPIVPDLIYENDLCIVFGGPNAGKTVLITQTMESIASGKVIGCFSSEVSEAVLYLDLEMDERKLAKRYEAGNGVYRFSENIIRMHMNRDYVGRLKAKDIIEQAIEKMREYSARVLVVDNFSAMGVEHEKSADALELMRLFRQVTTHANGTIIVAAHTPKRSGNETLQLKDLAGSAVISNFADSIIGIGQDARNPNRRYLKGFKNRDSEKKYCGPQVLECEIKKAENGLVFFEQVGTTYESHMLVNDQEADRIDRNNSVLQLKDEGKSYNEIAKQLDLPIGTVRSIVQRREK